MSDIDDNYLGVLLEEIRDQNKALLEAAATQATHDDINRIEDRLTSIEQDTKVIKAAATDQSKELTDHEHRITQLESHIA